MDLQKGLNTGAQIWIRHSDRERLHVAGDEPVAQLLVEPLHHCEHLKKGEADTEMARPEQSPNCKGMIVFVRYL